MRVYHRTTDDAANVIVTERRFVSLEDGDVFVSNRSRGQGVGYGPAVVRMDIPAALLRLDDEFPDGERHYRVSVHAIRPEWIR